MTEITDEMVNAAVEAMTEAIYGAHDETRVMDLRYTAMRRALAAAFALLPSRPTDATGGRAGQGRGGGE